MAMATERPRVNDHEFCRSVLAVPSSVGLLRDLAEVQLAKWGASTSFIEDATLVVSELATNSVTACPGRLVELRMRVAGAALVLEMWDPSPAPPRRREAGVQDVGGRGLAIVEHLADTWGTRWPSDGGKCVWAGLSVQSRTTR